MCTALNQVSQSDSPSPHSLLCHSLCASLFVAECVLLVLVHWMLHLHDVPLLRVVNKFVEADAEKVDRLMELHQLYKRRLQAAGERLVDSANSSPADYSRRLSSGLYALQLCCLLLAFLYTAGEARLAAHIRAAFYQRDGDVTEICEVLDEQRARMEEGGDEQTGQQVMKRTITQLSALVQGGPTVG